LAQGRRQGQQAVGDPHPVAPQPAGGLIDRSPDEGDHARLRGVAEITERAVRLEERSENRERR
jgi:hypothetical protein